MGVLLRALRALLPVLRLKPWVLLGMITLGVLAALSEGLSISLFIPLVENQMGSAGEEGFTGRMLAFFQGIPPERRLLWIGSGILFGILLKNCLSYGYGVLFQWVNASIGHRLRCGILQQLLSVSPSYFDTHDSGEVLNILATDTWRVTSAFSVLAGVVINICMMLILGVLLLLISWRLTLITALLLLIISCIVQRVARHVKQLGEQATVVNENFYQRILEVFESLPLIRAFGRERHEQHRFEAASLDVSKVFFRLDKTGGLVQPLAEVLVAPLLLGILVVMSLSAPGQIAVSLTFLILLYRLQPRVRQLDADRVALEAFSGSVRQVRGFLDRGDKPYLRSGSEVPAPLKKGIRFENVSFHYGSARNAALERVTCLINMHETTAVVGPSGAGKSSLINLVCRFYDPTSGRLLVDDVPLPELDLAWWRNQIAVVSQEVSLFNATVADNIIYGKLDATREELVEAARKAHALEFIREMPNGFETIIGDRGLRLSGGQRQRLALARAFIRDPQILILDEATNSLDLISEKVVQDALEQFGQGRTVLIIAHRISTIEHADKVIVLDGGRVVESGTVPQLLASGGLFARFYALQLRKKHAGQESPAQAVPAQ